MALKDILVTTTSNLDGCEIKEYIQPISAHLVAGTGLFSDIAASFSDVFGGRSQSYQRQISSLYSDAIQQLKTKAFEVGANGIIGLSVDMDEISGKGKSMFMITALGTAVRIDKQKMYSEERINSNKITVDDLLTLNKKQVLLKEAVGNKLFLTDDTWMFLKENKVHEIFSFIIDKWQVSLAHDPDTFDAFYKHTLEYVDSLPEEIKYKLVYTALVDATEYEVIKYLSHLVRDLHLLNLDLVKEYLNSEEFRTQKRALVPLLYDKSHYDVSDTILYKEIADIIRTKFSERGQRTTKKQMLSSKEKEVWLCECGKQNEIGEYCSSCGCNIYGFKSNEVKPEEALFSVERRVELINELLNNKGHE